MKRLESEKSREINYSCDIALLEEFYEKQYELIQKGNTDLATLELVMLGNALDFIQFIKTSLKAELDTSEKSVPVLEEVLDAMSRGIAESSIYDIENSTVAVNAAAYLGFLIIANIGGKWVDTQNGAAVSVSDRQAFVSDFIRQRLKRNSELNTIQYYNSVKIMKGSE